MKISKLTIVGFHKTKHKTYEFNDFTYFYGKNGVGKSTVLQAIQLALLGYIPGTNKNKTAIFQHANGNLLSVELTLTTEGGDNYLIRRSWTRKGKEINAELVTVPEDLDIGLILGSISLPILDFNEFISMTSNKLKDWFIQFLPSSDSDIDLYTRLMDTAKEYPTNLSEDFINEVRDYIKNDTHVGIEQVRELNSYLKNMQSFKKNELQRVQGTIESLIHYDDCDTSINVNELKSQNQYDETLKTQINNKIFIMSQNAAIHAELDKLTTPDVSLDSINDNIQILTDLLEVLAERQNNLNANKLDLKSKINQISNIISGGGRCPYNDECCKSILDKLPDYEAQISELSTKLHDIESEYDGILTEISSCKSDLSKYNNTKRQIEVANMQRESLLNSIDHSVDGISPDELRNGLCTITQQIIDRTDLIIKIEANKKSEMLLDTVTKEKYTIEQVLDLLKVWIKLTDVNGIQAEMVEAPFKHLSATMDEYLRQFFSNSDNSCASYFNISGGANSFSFGIEKDDVSIHYELLSSGEKCLYTLALICSMVKISDTLLPLILVDDLLDHLDSEKIQQCFETLYNISDLQIILAGVQACNHPESGNIVISL